MLTTVLLGNKVEFKVRFKHQGEPVNPSSVIFTVEKRGEPDSPETLDSSGSPDFWFTADFKPPTSGVWRVQAKATSPDGVVVNTFRVTPNSFEE